MTDPYVVRCPACLAEPGERCTNRIRTLDSVHWARHRVARQRRALDGRKVPATSPSPSSTRELAPAGRGARGRSG